VGGKSGKRGLVEKHEEVKLVHEMKQEVYSRDKARHTEKGEL